MGYSNDQVDSEVRGAWCQMCGPGRASCFTRCYVAEGRWQAVEGCPNSLNNRMHGATSLCAKGAAAPASIDHEGRLLYPLRRIGPKGPGARFERISWDAALDEIAQTLLDQKQRYGAETFGILSPQYTNFVSALGRRFLNVHGSPNFLHSGICHVQRNVSIYTVLGGPNPHMPNSTVPMQLDKTELLVCWGVNVENSGVNLGGPRMRLEQMARGMKVIDIRPLCDPLASKADIWLPIRPGTDLALALGILHVICGEELYDRAFVESHCSGFDQLAAHVRQFTPEWAEQRCGIPAQRIVEVARMMAAAKPCAIQHGNGIGDQCRDGHWTLVVIQLIGALCGNIGKPGGGADALACPPTIPAPARLDTLASRLQPSEDDLAHGWAPGTSRLVASEFPRWCATIGHGEVTSSYHGALRSILSGEPFPMRALFAHATNPLSATRQPKMAAQALDKVDFFFVMDAHPNPSCDYAEIVLPAASQYECAHTFGMQNGPQGTFLAASQQLADPPGEAISDWEVYLKLACRMGYGADFWEGEVDACLNEQLAPTGYTIQQLRTLPEGVFVPRESWPPSEPSPTAEPDYDALFARLAQCKVPCVNQDMAGREGVRDGAMLSALPVYRGPIEGLAETPDVAQDYPLVFSDVHAHRLSQHSYYDSIASLRRFEADPWVKIHPDTAAYFGIEEGDWVRVESPHGWCVLKARLTQGVSEQVLMGRRGWWQACSALGRPGYSPLDGGAETSVLYDAGLDNIDDFHSAMGKQTLVRIARSDVPPVEYHSNALVGEAPWQDEASAQCGTGAATGGQPAIAGAQAGTQEHQEDRPCKGFHFDSRLCSKCHACEVACAQWHGMQPGQKGYRVVEEAPAQTGSHARLFDSRAIKGCDLCVSTGASPRCAAVCPNGALVAK